MFIYGFLVCLYMHLFWQVFEGNSRVTQNGVTNSSYTRLSFVKKIHPFLFDRSISHVAKFYSKIDKYFPFAKSTLRENSFTHLRYFLSFLLFVFIDK